MSRMRVLVTGGTGFIGRFAITRLLESGFEVYALTRGVIEKLPHRDRLIWVRGDFHDESRMNELMSSVKPEYLLHFAWYVGEGYLDSWENSRDLFSSLRLAELFADAGGRRILVSGSLFEYDHRYSLFTEGDTPLSELTLYARAKNALFALLTEMSARRGISLAWGRVFPLYGPGEKATRLVPQIIASLLRDEHVVLKKPYFLHDYMYVKDTADAMVTLLASTVEGAVNISTGFVVLVEGLAGIIADLMGRKAELTKAQRDYSLEEHFVVCGNPTRLNCEVGWMPKYTLAEGLTETISYWKSRLPEENRGEL